MKYMSLLIGSLFGYVCTYAQCPITIPVAVDSCYHTSGSVVLGASGSTGFYNWYSNPTGGTPINSGDTFTTPALTTNTTYYVAAIDTNSSLYFDGIDDYVALNKSYNTAGAIPTLTVEAWVNTQENATGDSFSNWSVVDFDRSEYFNVFISGEDGEVAFGSSSVSSQFHDMYSGAGNTVNDGNWHHIACVYDGTDKIIYIDGIEVNRSINPHGGEALGRSSLTRFGFIGDGSESATFDGNRNDLYYHGFVDDVRIWNDVRTPTELLTHKDSCLEGTEAGLEAYYKFSEYSGTTLSDLTGNGYDGTLMNMTSQAWSPGAPITCNCESNRVAAVAIIGDASLVAPHIDCDLPNNNLDAGSGYATYTWSTGETTQVITPSTTGVYTITTTNGLCPYTDTVTVTGDHHSRNALVFDGTDDRIAIQKYRYEQTGHREVTVEAWIKTSDPGNQIIATFDRSEFWRFQLNFPAGDGRVGWNVNTDVGIVDFGSNQRVDDGMWHHVCGVFDHGTMRIYIDGVLDVDTITGGSFFGSNIVRYGFVGVGSEAASFNGTTGPDDYFNGEIDEFRIWNVARSEAEIRSSMAKTLTGNETGLDIYYKFDQTGSDTEVDFSGATRANGSLINFPASPYIVSGAPIGDESAFLYTGSWSGQTVSLNSCDGESFSLSNMGGVPSGVHVYYVHHIPNDVGGIAGIGSNDRYFGVFKVNDAAATYTATYDYAGNPYVYAGNEPTLALFTRSDNAAGGWSNAGATLNTTAQTLTSTAQSTEFILGSTGLPLPIELLDFTAAVSNGNTVELNWTTASEVNNAFFTIERSLDAERWEEVLDVPAQPGASHVLRNYEAVDQEPHRGVSYYRLKQTDFDGQYTYSKVVSVRILAANEFVVYPNPAQQQITLQGLQLDHSAVSIYDATGRNVTNTVQLLHHGEHGAIFDISELKNGLYLIRTASHTGTLVKQ